VVSHLRPTEGHQAVSHLKPGDCVIVGEWLIADIVMNGVMMTPVPTLDDDDNVMKAFRLNNGTRVLVIATISRKPKPLSERTDWVLLLSPEGALGWTSETEALKSPDGPGQS